MLWFLIQTAIFFYSGLYISDFEKLQTEYKYSGLDLFFIWSIVQYFFTSLGVVILIPFIFKGMKIGLILGILHCAFGVFVNPFWYFLPNNLLLNGNNDPSILQYVINFSWPVFMVSVVISFYFVRRAKIANQ